MAKIAQTPEQAPQNVDLTSILARLEASEAKTKELEAKLTPENKFLKGKERYEWPRNYSFRLWGGVPALSYKSVKKDLTKDFTYKNHLWVQINNHFLEVSLANGKTETIDVNEFNLNRVMSDKIPAEPVTDGVTVTWYRFTIPDYEPFIVSSNLIN